ncbi:MAG: FecCD family ABC transporter permease [Acidimicrobiia bacterium]
MARSPAHASPSLLGAAIAALGVLAAVSVALGPAGLGLAPVLREVGSHFPVLGVTSGLTDREAAIIWELRMPRVALGGMVGAMLGAAGAAYQGVFRNPLADPYLLGVAAGAGLGATGAIAYGPGGALVPVAAFTGGVMAVALTYALGRTAGLARGPATLILAGVAVAAFLTALQTYLQQRRLDSIREVYSWILGRLGTVGWGEVVLILPYVMATAVAILASRRLLDVLAVGEEEAATLGVRPERLRLVLVGAATLGTAAAVSVSGLIGFVGLVVPHAIRLVLGPSYRVIVPLSMVLGAAFLILADLIARTVVAPGELPIGVVTAFVGAPFFAMVLRTGTRGAG